MTVKKIEIKKTSQKQKIQRPQKLTNFIGQENIKQILQTAINSSQKTGKPIGHILFAGPSGYGKTTLAQIIAKETNKNFFSITAYAITKPAELISMLSNLQSGDILFIDEIHRLKPNLEEILYNAMEDFFVDILSPEGEHIKIPLADFTLIGATTKLEKLSTPLKNRFVYNFFFQEYSTQQKLNILNSYLQQNQILCSEEVLEFLEKYVETTPRNIANFCIQLKDFIIDKFGVTQNYKLNLAVAKNFIKHLQVKDGGLSPIHQKYLEILQKSQKAVGLKTISAKLGIGEKSIEEDIEPILLKLGLIEKTPKGRILNQ